MGLNSFRFLNMWTMGETMDETSDYNSLRLTLSSVRPQGAMAQRMSFVSLSRLCLAAH